MSEPKASFLLPAFNAERYIALTLKSLFSQTCQDFEIVAVNDGSQDTTGKILEQLAEKEPKLRVIHQDNLGQAAAMNRGLSECSAPLVALIDADDLCLPDRVRRQVEFMDRHPEVTASGTAVQFIDSAGAPLAIEINPPDHDDIENLLLSGIGGAIIAPSAMLRKDAVIAVGGFSERFSMVQDLDIYLRLGEVGRLANLTEVLVCYRKHLEAANFALREKMVMLIRAVLNEAAARRVCALPRFALGEYVAKPPAGYHQEWAFLALQNGYRASAIKHTCLAVWKGRFKRERLKFLKYALTRLTSCDLGAFPRGGTAFQ